MSLMSLIAPGRARVRTAALVLALGGLLGACSTFTPEPPAGTGPYVGADHGRAAVSSPSPSIARNTPSRSASGAGGRYKVGAPYQAGGVWYVPAEQPGYDEVGLASWYGDAFDHKPTANGEMFDMRALSAAHATLPMPCIVEVTNLENGKALQVRMNDRGPFHPGRIIDLSRAAAEELGYAVKGTARVRVRYVGPAPLDELAMPVANVEPARAATLGQSALRPLPTYQIAPPSRAHAEPAAHVAGGGYVVQAGAFSSRDAARQVAERLSSAGSTAVKPLDRGGATLSRVLVGPWSDSQSASAARGQVMAMGFSDARVVPGS
jgi:rare lipoprotein A